MFTNINNVHFHLTDTCNLNCSYCYLKETGKDADNLAVSKETVDVFLEKYMKQERDNISVSFWGGEPLICFDMIKYIIEMANKYTVNKFKKNNYLIVTNGTLINYEIADFCKKYNVWLQISLDGGRKCHDMQRISKDKKGTYDKVVSKINLLEKLDIKYSVRTTLTGLSPLPSEIIKEFKKKGITGCSFGIVTPNSMSNREDFSPLDGIKIADNLFLSFVDDFKSNQKFNYYNINVIFNKFFNSSPCTSCGLSENKILIKYDGTIYPCHRFVNSPEYCIGDIFNGITEKCSVLYDSVIKNNNKCNVCESGGILCGGACLYEISKRDINYTQEDICVFYKRLHINMLKYIVYIYRYDKEKYNEFCYNYLGKNVNNLEMIKVDIDIASLDNYITFSKSANVKCIDLYEEGVLYLFDNLKKYIVNPTAMAIWDLLDGQRTAQQIAQEIANVCEVDFEAIKDDIYGQLAAFQELGLVEEVAAASHA